MRIYTDPPLARRVSCVRSRRRVLDARTLVVCAWEQSPLRALACTMADNPDHVAANLALCASLPRKTGVRPMSVDPNLAAGLAAFLLAQWVPTGHLVLRSSHSTSRRTVKLHGHVTYPLTALPHDGHLQRRHTLV
jgi:hypothetical protein